jgi:ABC-type bacteriocin/lantibiotic exporter with double-glycine peptidase domain
MSVPFYSQHAADVPEEWRRRACGVIALRMALAHFGKEVSPAELIEAGVAAGAYDPKFGWRHDGLVALAQAHGVEASRKEFKKNLDEGIAHLRAAVIAAQVPIVSLRVEGMTDTHLVALVGADTNGFFYNDPALDSATGQNIFVSNVEFSRRWRGLAIFIG